MTSSPNSLALLFGGGSFLIGCLGSGGYREGGSLYFESDYTYEARHEGITGTESLEVHWYGLNTKAKHEGLVAQQFEHIGIECFFVI